jgi:hypothetical protein
MFLPLINLKNTFYQKKYINLSPIKEPLESFLSMISAPRKNIISFRNNSNPNLLIQ